MATTTAPPSNEELGITNLIMSQKSCLDDFLLYGNILAIISLVLSTIAATVLYRTPKRRHFPHNLPLLICISSATHFFGETLQVFFTDETLAMNARLCWITACISHTGLVLVFWIWILSFIVLYLATVKQVYIIRIRKKRRHVFRALFIWTFILLAIPWLFGTYQFSPRDSRCVLHMDSEWLLFLFSIAWVAIIVFIILAPRIIKTLLQKDNQLLARNRILMLREEAIRQTMLGVVMFVTVIIAGYRYGIVILVVEHAKGSINASWFQNLMYTSCASDIIWDRQFGAWIALLYLASIENYRAFRNWWRERKNSCEEDNIPVFISDDNDTTTNVEDHKFYNVVKSPRSCKSGFPGAYSARSQVETLQDSVMNNNTAAMTATTPIARLLCQVREKLELDGMRLDEHDTMSIVEEVASTIENDSLFPLPRDLDARVEAAENNWIRNNVTENLQ